MSKMISFKCKPEEGSTIEVECSLEWPTSFEEMDLLEARYDASPEEIQESVLDDARRAWVIWYQTRKRANWDGTPDPDQVKRGAKADREAAVPVNIIPDVTAEQVAGIIRAGKKVTGVNELPFGWDEIRSHLDA